MTSDLAVIRVDPDVRRVATLAPHEVYRGQVFHAGHLWLGHSSEIGRAHV